MEGGLGLVLARGLAVAGMLTAFGTLLFGALVLPRALVRAPDEVASRLWSSLSQLARAELALAGLATPVWLVLASAAMAGAAAPGAVPEAVAAVLRDTSFGHLVLLTFLALSVTAVALGRGGAPERWGAG